MQFLACTSKANCKKPLFSFCFQCGIFMCALHHKKHEPDEEEEDPEIHETYLVGKLTEIIDNPNSTIEDLDEIAKPLEKHVEKSASQLLDLVYFARGNLLYGKKEYEHAIKDYERIENTKFPFSENMKSCQRELYKAKQMHVMKSLTWIKQKKEYLRRIYSQNVIRELLDLSAKYSKLLSLSPGLADRKRFENILKRDHFIVYLLGEINVGKSTLINALLGRNVMHPSVNPSTARRCHISYGKEDHVQLESLDGSVSEEAFEKLKEVQLVTIRDEVDHIKRIQVFLNDPLLESGVELVDTPGSGEILKSNKNTNLVVNYKTDSDVQESSAVIYIVHARSQNTSTLKDLAAQKRIVVINQIDILSSVSNGEEVDSEREELLNHITQLCSSRYSLNTHIHGISAKEALSAKINGTKIPENFQNFENDLYTFIEKNFRVETSDLVFDLMNIEQVALDIANSQFTYQLDEKKKAEAMELLKLQARQLKDEYKKIVEKNTENVLREISRLLKDKNILNGICNRCIECPQLVMGAPITESSEKMLLEQFYQALKYYLDGAIIAKSTQPSIIERVITEFIVKVKDMISKLEQKDSLLDAFCARYWARVEQDLQHNYTIETKDPQKVVTFTEKLISGTQYVLSLIGIRVNFVNINTEWIVKNATYLWDRLDAKDITIEIMEQFISKGFSNLLISQKISDFEELYTSVFSRVSSSFNDWSSKAKYNLALRELETSALYNLLTHGPVELGEKIGQSPLGQTVFQGRWKDKDVAIQRVVFDFGNGQVDPTSHVIKMINFEKGIKEETKNFFLDLYYNRILSHECLVKYEGACLSDDEKEIYLCTELLDSLEYVFKSKLQYKEMITFGHDIATGLNQIHNHGRIHCNLKPSNIFIDRKRGRAKVGDLGKKNLDKNALLYASPEVQSGKAYSFSTDVYSFGVLLAQILNGGKPPTSKPVVPKGVESGISNLLQSCWNEDPKKRPKMSEVVSRLSLIKSQIL